MGCLTRYQSHLGPERGALVGISTWHPECKVMHLNVGGGQVGYLSQYQLFWALKGAMDLSWEWLSACH